MDGKKRAKSPGDQRSGRKFIRKIHPTLIGQGPLRSDVDPYVARDMRLRRIHIQALAARSLEEIRSKAHCSWGMAWLIHSVREIAAVELLDAWVTERITWGQLWRLACHAPGDTEAQMRHGLKISSVRRALTIPAKAKQC